MNTNHEKLLKYLESYKGRMIQAFDTNEEAKAFAEGMRKNIGDSGIATVELSYNRVIVQVSDVAITVTK
ncbi:MAG: hypothetical protein RL662_2380 [Bacteroidota bacterium]|jgi:hypothetical protein